MQQLIYFIRKFRYFLLFILLEILAFYFTIQHHSYHKSKFVNSANFVSGGLYEKVTFFNDFFNLRIENKLLNEENAQLKNVLGRTKVETNSEVLSVLDTSAYAQKYEYTIAKIINNNYTKRNNTLTLNVGSNNGLTPDLGVVNSKGIIGVVKNVSPHYATVLSILNANSKINVRLKNSFHFGTLIWNGADYNILQIIDIPRQAKFKKGDTIVTGGKSTIFPEGIPVGIINDFEIKNNQYHQINILLFNDMSSISQVQIIKNLQKEEQLNLEQKSINE